MAVLSLSGSCSSPAADHQGISRVRRSADGAFLSPQGLPWGWANCRIDDPARCCADAVVCCFSRPVQYVARTRIFARPTQSNRQVVVYQMNFAAEEALAMILPLPFKSGADPREFRFVNLSEYPKFFTDLNSGFPVFRIPPELARRYGGTPEPAPKLEVFQVGSFEASFVPAIADFDRLDDRFRVDPALWRSLPG